MQLTIDADCAGAEAMLSGIEGRLDNPSGLLQVLGDALVEYESDLFASGGNGQWAPLAPATLAQKSGGRILVDTGGLLDAMTAGPRIEGEDVVTGTPPEYAGYLKAGARGAPRRDPAPAPTGGEAAGWAEDLLGAIVRGA